MTVDFVLDVNVLVSAQISTTRAAPPLQALAAVRNPRFQHYVSASLLAEFSTVMRRPRLARLHGLRPAEIDEIALALARASIDLLVPRCTLDAPDPEDQYLWDMLGAYGDLILVTGDRLLLESGDFPGRVITPRQFVSRHLTQ